MTFVTRLKTDADKNGKTPRDFEKLGLAMAEDLRWTARYRGISVFGDGGVLGGGVKVVDGG